jgi:hypothetical protein
MQFCAFVKGGLNSTFSISYWVFGIPFASQFQVRVVGLSWREAKGRSWTRFFLKACLLNVCIPFAIQFEVFERGWASPVPFACSVGGRFELDSFSSSMPIECLHSVCHSVWSVEKGLCFAGTFAVLNEMRSRSGLAPFSKTFYHHPQTVLLSLLYNTKY